MAIASGPDLGDHEPDRRGRAARGHGQRRADGQRPGRGALDPAVPRRARPTASRAGDGQPPARRARSRDPAGIPGVTVFSADVPGVDVPGLDVPLDSPSTPRRSTSRPATDGPPVSDGAATADPQIIFTPSGRRGRAPAGTTVLDAARSLGVDIDSVCGGRGICGRCAVVPAFGSFAKHGITSSPDHLSPPGEVEAAYRAEQRPRRRSPAVLHGHTARRRGRRRPAREPGPQARSSARTSPRGPSRSTRSTRLHTVDVTEPDLATPTGDLGRLFDALRDGVGPRRTCTRTFRSSARSRRALTAGDYRVTVAVHGGRDVIAVWPGFHDRAFGVAIDVGSTTIAGHLVNLTDGSVLASAGVMNPQIRFGEDLMSRVSYVMMHRGRRGGADRGGPQGARRPARHARRTRPASSAPRSSSSRSSATRSCTTSCSASTRRRSGPRRSPWRRMPPSS